MFYLPGAACPAVPQLRDFFSHKPHTPTLPSPGEDAGRGILDFFLQNINQIITKFWLTLKNFLA
jgi:hypothetical protein